VTKRTFAENYDHILQIDPDTGRLHQHASYLRGNTYDLPQEVEDAAEKAKALTPVAPKGKAD
jgi:hypothetical protein